MDRDRHAIPLPEHDGFEHDATPVLTSLREAVGQVLAQIPGVVTKPYHLVGRLGIDRALAWRLWQVAFGKSSLPEPTHIPGRVGIERFLNAAAKAGVPITTIHAAKDAFDRFDTLPASYGADRAAINVLLAQLGDRSAKAPGLDVRRDLFRAQTQILGVHARALYQVAAIFPAPGAFAPNVVLARGAFGLHRTRPGVSWVLGQSRLVATTGPHASYTRRPIDPRAKRESAPPLIDAFCSTPRPKVTRRLIDHATYEDILEPGPIGPKDAVDVVMGEVISNIPRDTSTRDAITMRATTPTERLCFDLFLHRDAATANPLPVASLFTLVHGDVPFHAHLRGELPTTDQPIEIIGPGTPPVEGVPIASQLVDCALEAAAHPRDEFKHYRITMRYPPIPVIAALAYTLEPAITRTTSRPSRVARR